MIRFFLSFALAFLLLTYFSGFWVASKKLLPEYLENWLFKITKSLTKSTAGCFVNRSSPKTFSDWLILILREWEFKITWIGCLLFLVFNLAYLALFFESKPFGTIVSFSCFCFNFVFLEVYCVVDELSTELNQAVSKYVKRLMTNGVIK